MRKIIFTAIMFLGLGTMAFAQQDSTKHKHKTPEEKAQHLTSILEKKLSLNADQKSKVYDISLQGIKQLKAAKVKGQKPDKALIKAEFEKRDAQINAILNDSQKKAYQDWKTEKMKAMKHRGKKGTGKAQ